MRAVKVERQEMLSRLVPQEPTHETSGTSWAGNRETFPAWPDVAGRHLADVEFRILLSGPNPSFIAPCHVMPSTFRPPSSLASFWGSGGGFTGLRPPAAPRKSATLAAHLGGRQPGFLLFRENQPHPPGVFHAG